MKRSFYIFMAFCVCVFLALGAWQVKRLAWKENLLRQIDHEQNIDARTTPLQDLHLDYAYSIRRGYMVGTLDMTKSVLWQGQIYESQPVSYVVAPLRVKGREKLIPVVLGLCQADCSEIKAVRHRGMKIFGVVKRHRENMFRPPNNLKTDEWYRMDARDLSVKWDRDVADFLFYAENKNIDPYLLPVPNVMNVPNNHKFYAIFWFSMALMIVGMSIYYFRQSRRNDGA